MIGAMPQSRLALQKLLGIAEAELHHIEAKLLESVPADEASALVERAAELRLKIEEIREILGEGK
jgi:hypothetical protein